MNSPNVSTGTGKTSTAKHRASSEISAQQPSRATRGPAAYRGRFAPSPTGPLHAGSLLAAVASFMRAKQQQGQWLLRIEDIDPPREVAGATDAILRSLEAHGLHWDEELRYQSQHLETYAAVVDRLLAAGSAYACTCSRKSVRGSAPQGIAGPVYPGTCRHAHHETTNAAIRLRTEPVTIEFTDLYCGPLTYQLESQLGDFIIRRRDGLSAYVIACVLDDAEAGITEIIRGDDILGFTPAQIWLQRQLGLEQPGYGHIPVLRGADGEKLSKQTGAPAVDDARAGENICQALVELGCRAPVELRAAPVAEVWAWVADRGHRMAPGGQ